MARVVASFACYRKCCLSGVSRLAAQRGLRGVEHAVELAEHPVMTAALDNIETAIVQGLGQMIGGARRDDGVVASLPDDRGHVDLRELQAPRGAEQAQILTRTGNAGPQALAQRRLEIG